MQEDRTATALGLIAALMRWEMDSGLHWDASAASLASDDGQDVVWSVRPAVGGPVRIAHRCHPLHRMDAEQLASAAKALVATGREVDMHGEERAEFEYDMKRSARSLLRRKAAAGIRLVDVVSQTIPTDFYQYIGLDVTFAWGPAGSESRETFEVGSEADLREQFDRLLAELGETPWRRAA